MTDRPTSEQAAGIRRAAVFLLHNGNRDIEGINAVLAEMTTHEDRVHFLFGVGNLFESVIPVVFSQTGQWMVRQLVADLAGVEHSGGVQ